MTFILEGSITYIVDDKKYVLNKNDAIFIKAGSKRERLKSEESLHFISFNFDIVSGTDLSLPVYLPNSFTPDMKKLIFSFPQSHIAPNNYSRQKVANILNVILLDLLEPISLRTQNYYADQILSVVDNRLNERLTLKCISDEVNLSKEYVSTIFKKHIGQTPLEIRKQK